MGSLYKVDCREVTVCPGLPVILGSSTTLTYEGDILWLDGWAPINIRYDTSALLTAFRAAMECLMLRIAHSPTLIGQNDPCTVQLAQLLTELCVPEQGNYMEELS